MKPGDSPEKLCLTCSVPMMALLIRFIIETKNVEEETKVSEVVRFFAEHFRTPIQKEISVQSLRGKYDKPLPVHLDQFKKWMKQGIVLCDGWERRLYG